MKPIMSVICESLLVESSHLLGDAFTILHPPCHVKLTVNPVNVGMQRGKWLVVWLSFKSCCEGSLAFYILD
jgi:hypothetical protein